MYPHEIFGLFTLYGVMVAIGVLCAVGVLFIFAKNRVSEKFIDFLFYNGIIAIAIGFVFASLFQAVYDYIANPEGGFHPFTSGMTFYGGLIGGVVSFLAGYFIFRKKLAGRLLDVISLLPCCILVAHAFGRLGCLFAGCCHGAEVDGFPGIYMETVDAGNGYFIPIQLYEALFLFALFGTCLFLYTKKGFKYNLPTYLISYGVWRFIIEYARADYRGALVEGITPSQFWSIIMVVAGVGIIFLFKYMFKIHEANKAKEQEKLTVEGDVKD